MHQSVDKFFILEQQCEGPFSDIYENDSEYILNIDLPGYDIDEISVKVYDQWVVIECLKPHNYDSSLKYICLERCCSPLKRVFRLPSAVRSVDAEAVYSKGVLSLKLQKNRVVFTEIEVVKK